MRNYRSDSDSESPDGDTSASPAQASESYMQYMETYEKDIADEDTSFTGQTIDEEYSTYVASAPNLKRQAKLDPLKFWEVSTASVIWIWFLCLLADIYNIFKANRETFPTICRMAFDYLPVQASSVPCERVFSSSADTDTNKRNRISADLMEALQLLKYAYKKERLNFTQHLLTHEDDLTGDAPELVGIDKLAESLKRTESHASTNDLLMSVDWI